MFVTAKALKTITKKGGLDEYLLNTTPKQIDSKFGMYLRNIITTKQEDPEAVVPFIPMQKKVKKSNVRVHRSAFGAKPAVYQAPQFRVRPEFIQTKLMPH